MTVVVTGAAGFLGRHLVQRLADRGERVVAVDRRPVPPGAAAVRLMADLAEPSDDVVGALREADAVFHLAARPGVRAAGPPAALAALRHRDNVIAALPALTHPSADAPVVVTSSSSVYGGSPPGRGSREDDPLRPGGGYARSKATLELLCARRAARGGLVAVARPFTVAGEGQRTDMALAGWLAAARAGRPLTILGSPDRTRDVTDVADVVTGLVALADRGVNGTVNLGTGTGHRLGDLTAAVAAAVGHPVTVHVRPAGRDEPPHTLADTGRCRRLLGFVPATDLAAVFRRQATHQLGPATDGSWSGATTASCRG